MVKQNGKDHDYYVYFHSSATLDPTDPEYKKR